MVTPFGFSVGDFVAGIELIRHLINALEDSAGSSSEYRELIKELYSLERALLEVKHLDLDASQHAQLVALRQAATQCQQTIDEFLIKVRKFQPTFRAGGAKSSWRDSLRKMEWALYKKEDVERFRAQLSGHTASINMLMMTIQLQSSTIQNSRLEQQQHVNIQQSGEMMLANQGINTNQQILNTHTDLILSLTKLVTNAATHEHTEELKDLMLKVLKANLQVFDIVRAMQGTMSHQIERQQPVLFLDACGRLSPIHLEFINSAEAFLAVLKTRFKDYGLQRIERKQFALEESQTKRVVDLRRPWHECFLPGRKINMSMIFTRAETPVSTCPGCQCESTVDTSHEVECSRCGMQYRRIHDLEPVDSLSSAPLAHPESPQNPRKRKLDTASHQSWSGQSLSASHGWEKPETYNEDEIHLFRRVHIKMRKPVDWSLKNKDGHILISSNSAVTVEVGDSEVFDRKAVALHCNKPFDGTFCYFEIEINYAWATDAYSPWSFGMGLCSSVQLSTLPGMSPDSWGYHSDDGSIFECVGSKLYKKSRYYGPRWSIGDIIGCGWHPVQNYIWFTHNGHYCGAAAKDIKSQALFPTVAFGRGNKGSIIANFGDRPFTFDLDEHWNREHPFLDADGYGYRKKKRKSKIAQPIPSMANPRPPKRQNSATFP